MAFTDFPPSIKSRLLKSKIKKMLIAFFDNDGIIHKEFVPAELHRTGKWMLQHNNVPAHCATRVHKLLAQYSVPVLSHSPYSPDRAPADLFLVPNLKSVLKGARFATTEAINS
ncbi:hypothetical protein PR048_025633 [Dryococelus australis]|uniref:Uncharacterized protein n=1 Tax=Dryococelus australis TaxID=614101 RepID=A0ABQ9GRW3_9NEOP|nr:hypothetical protein PR048_025633 [Dryococelus australis]